MNSSDPRDVVAGEAMHPRQVLVVALATALNALDGFDVLSIAFASPGVAAEWHVDQAALGTVLSMELIGMALGALTLGAVADRVGRRPIVLACLMVMAAGMALASLSTGVVMLAAVRLFTGLGIGGMLAATNAVVAECANARRRNLAVAIMAGGYPVGAVLGGTIASALLTATGGWRAMFVFGAGATALFIPLVLWLMPETIAFLYSRRPTDALVRINRVLACYGRERIRALPTEDPTRAKIVQGAAFSRKLAPMTVLLIVTYFCHIMTFYFLMKWLPKVVVDLGFTPAAAGGVLVRANIGGALGSFSLSLLTQWFDPRRLVIGAMACAALAVTALGQGPVGLTAISLIALVCGFFTNGATAGLYAVIAQAFPAPLRAGGTGMVIGLGRGGAALGPILAGALFQAGLPLAIVAPLMASGTMIGALTLALAPQHRTEGP